MIHWLAHVLGLDSGSGGWYLFSSGFGANFGELAIVGGLLAIVRHHNCHAKGCPRIGRHKVPGTDFSCCARHTPGGAPTHAHILALHRQHTERLAALASGRRGASGERLYNHDRDSPEPKGGPR